MEWINECSTKSICTPYQGNVMHACKVTLTKELEFLLYMMLVYLIKTYVSHGPCIQNGGERGIESERELSLESRIRT